MTTATVVVPKAGPVFRAQVYRPCGHVFYSRAGHLSVEAAQRHGDTLARCDCPQCEAARR